MMVTSCPSWIVSVDAAFQLVPLKRTLPWRPGMIAVSAVAVLPIISSGRSLSRGLVMRSFFLIHLLNAITERRETPRKVNICVFREISINITSTATVQAPSPKKKRMNPGTANSRRKKTKPMINHITGVLKNCSMNKAGFFQI